MQSKNGGEEGTVQLSSRLISGLLAGDTYMGPCVTG